MSGFYRGPGGTGDATGDAVNEAVIAIAASTSAASSATSASTSATNASSSATAAAASAASVNDTNLVHISGTETITGTKTFSSTITGSISGNAATATTATNQSGGAVSATTLAASSTVSGTGFSTYLASPPAIGGTTPSTGKFTNVTNTALTSGRVTYVTTGGLLTDSANMAFDGTTITSSFSGSVGTTTRSTVKATTLDLGLSTQSVAIGQGNASIMKNRIINGAMVIDQRNAGASSTNTSFNQYALDRWAGLSTAASKYSIPQNAGSVTPPVGFSNYLGVTSLTALTPSSGDLYGITQAIEGFNTADLGWGTANAKTVTISFQVYSSITGTFGGVLKNSAANRNYPFTYSISVANTWTTISVTIAGDTSGTWVGATNGIGIRLVFSIGTGATYSGTAGAWGAGDLYSATGSQYILSTNGATFYITGVQLEVGSSATGFEYRQYGQELALCQRYYFKDTSVNGFVLNGTGTYSSYQFKTNMRSAATVITGSGTVQGSSTAGFYAQSTGTASSTVIADSEL